MALIPQHYLDAVGVLEKPKDGEAGTEFFPVATATLLGYQTSQESENSEELRHWVVLVTNRHVVEGEAELMLRFNQGTGSQRFRLALRDGNGNCLFHQSQRFDIAVVPLKIALLDQVGANYSFIPEVAFLDISGMEREEVVSGDGVFVLGFPMGLAGKQRKFAVVRTGVVARVDEEIVSKTNSYLIDCPVFPGNSGGPVITKPEAVSVAGTKTRDRVHLIGIVSGYLPYEDVAVSLQTQRPRVSFEENSGLTEVVPLDAVHELVRPMVAEAETELKEASKTSADGVGEAELVPEPEAD